MAINVPAREFQRRWVSPFVYPPLKDHDKAIRLLQLLPDLRDGRVQIEIRQTKRTPGTYCCLSYQWGQGYDDERIFANGQTLEIRKNLYDFLDAARLRFQYSPLWIDALCINQQDDNEKGHQVRRMGQIYTDAAEVFVWLGKEPELDYLFDFSKQYYQEYIAQIQSTSARRAGLHRLSEGHPEKVVAWFRQLLNHAYWWRAWIAQEVLLAKRIYIMNGNKWIDFNLFCQVAYSIRYLTEVQGGILYTSPAMEFWERKQKGEVTMSRTQVFTFDWIWQAQCYDPRDRLYSILALLAPEPKLTAFEVDYTEDINSFFWRAGDHLRAWNGDWRLRKLLQTLGVTSDYLARHLRTHRPFLTVNGQYAGYTVHVPGPNHHGNRRCSFCKARIDIYVGPRDALLCSRDPWRSQHIILRQSAITGFSVTFQVRTVAEGSIETQWTEPHKPEVWYLEDGDWVPITEVPPQVVKDPHAFRISEHHFCVKIPASLVVKNLAALEAEMKSFQGTSVGEGVLPPYVHRQVQRAKSPVKASELVRSIEICGSCSWDASRCFCAFK